MTPQEEGRLLESIDMLVEKSSELHGIVTRFTEGHTRLDQMLKDHLGSHERYEAKREHECANAHRATERNVINKILIAIIPVTVTIIGYFSVQALNKKEGANAITNIQPGNYNQSVRGETYSRNVRTIPSGD